jgi:hypothetical protein
MDPIGDAIVDDDGLTPESFVREFLIAFRAYEVEAYRLMVEGEAEQARRAKAGDTDWYPEDADRTIDDLFKSVLERFATPRVLAQQLGPHFESPPMANVATTTFVGVQPRRGGVIVRTREIDDPILSPHDVEYWLKRMHGRWQLDDRREQDYEGKWRRFVL